jgi:uncharacterized protein YpiB (UPF0302 family)
MSKDDFITIHVLGIGALTVTATKAGRTVKLSTRGSKRQPIYFAQELSGRKVVHEIQANKESVVSIEKRFRYGSTS